MGVLRSRRGWGGLITLYLHSDKIGYRYNFFISHIRLVTLLCSLFDQPAVRNKVIVAV